MASNKNQIDNFEKGLDRVHLSKSDHYSYSKNHANSSVSSNTYNSLKTPSYNTRKSFNSDKSKKSMWNTNSSYYYYYCSGTNLRYNRFNESINTAESYHRNSSSSLYSSTDDSSSIKSNDDEDDAVTSDSSIDDIVHSTSNADDDEDYYNKTNLITNFNDLNFNQDNNTTVDENVLEDNDENKENKENQSSSSSSVKLSSITKSKDKLKTSSDIAPYKFKKRLEDNTGDIDTITTTNNKSSNLSNSVTANNTIHENDEDVESINSNSDHANLTSSSNESSFDMSDFKGRPSSCVFVASLSSTLTDDSLAVSVRRHFKEWGQIAFVKVLRDPSNRPYAFVQYTNDDDAKRAIREGQHSILNGRTIRCEKANVNRTLYLSTFSETEISKKEVSNIVNTFGEIENLVSLDENDEYIELNDDDKSNIWFCKFVYRDDAINAYASLKENKKFKVHWAKNLEMDDDGEPDIIIDNFSVFVGQLDRSITKEKLCERFKRHGQIKEAVLVNRPNINFAFIKYKTEAGAAAAVERENHSIFKSKTIQVQYREMFKNKRFNGSGYPKLTLAPPPVHFVKRLKSSSNQRSTSLPFFNKNKHHNFNHFTNNEDVVGPSLEYHKSYDFFKRGTIIGGNGGIINSHDKPRSISYSATTNTTTAVVVPANTGLGIHDHKRFLGNSNNSTIIRKKNSKNSLKDDNDDSDGDNNENDTEDNNNNNNNNNNRRNSIRPRSGFKNLSSDSAAGFPNDDNQFKNYTYSSNSRFSDCREKASLGSASDHGFYPPQIPYYFYIAPPSKEMQTYSYGYDGLKNLPGSSSNSIPIPIPPTTTNTTAGVATGAATTGATGNTISSPIPASATNPYYYPHYPLGPIPTPQFDPNLSPRSMEYVQIPPYYMYYGPSYQTISPTDENYNMNFRENDNMIFNNPKLNARNSNSFISHIDRPSNNSNTNTDSISNNHDNNNS